MYRRNLHPTRLRRITPLLLAIAAVCSVAPIARAQSTDDPPTQPAADTPQDEVVELNRETPRATATGFLRAMQEKSFEDAARYLDLREIDEDRRAKRGPELAGLLYDVLTRRQQQALKPEAIPDDADYEDPTAPEAQDNRYRYQLAEDEAGKGAIVLERNDAGQWLFSHATIAALPALYKTVETQPAPTTQAVAEAGIPLELNSPRQVVQVFVEAMEDAADDPDKLEIAMQCMDLSEMTASLREERGPARARLLKTLIDLTLPNLVYLEIPNESEGPPQVLYSHPEGNIVVAHDDTGQWKFTAATVKALPDIYSELTQVQEIQQRLEDEGLSAELTWDLWLQSKMPKSLRGRWLGIESWQWLTLFLLALAGVIGDFLVRKLIGAIVEHRFSSRHFQLDEKLRRSAMRPIGLLAMGLIWFYGLRILVLPDLVDEMLVSAARIVICVAAVWSGWKLIDLICGYLASVAARTPSRFDDLLIPLLNKALKIIATVIAIVFLAEFFDWSLTNVLAGLGIGGLAIGFAAREMLQNFFGSIGVLLDRPFDIGDWIRVDDVEGTVEEVSFRTTRVRTFYNSLITMPNGTLLTAKVDNLGARRYRRTKTMLSLTYDTPPEKIEAFCEGIRELIRQHPYTRKDYYHVYFNEFADSSLNVLLYCFHETPDWGTELRERHRLYNDILRLARLIGVSFAFPTQTIHLHQEATEADLTPPPPGDSEAITTGRKAAQSIITEAGLPGTFPPPVVIDPKESRGEIDDGDG